ncbi:pirin family protein [Agaribacter flavus]|uniref:Pirin family protein n=1 Tax=Agaribacter flavus TaxID=1902781 RepID=A0ABV7FMJ6_9ALTE
MTTVKQIVRGLEVSDGAGVKLKRVIGQRELKRLDPFLMLDEFGSDQASDYIAGFPSHPHRGFQTVTYMLQGKMGHKDSVGNQGVIEDGGLQWMNAGKGIIHEEMPQQTEGKLRGFQLWVNLPSSEKMSTPAYEDIQSHQVPELSIGNASNELDKSSKLRILAGSYKGVSGPIKTHAVSPRFFDIHLYHDDSVSIDVDSSHQGFVYVYDGSLQIGQDTLQEGELGVLEFNDILEIQGQNGSDGKAIFVSAKPIGEPVAQYGPFVMNSQSEIEQALDDYRAGRLTS